eukprot:scaffold4729_cov145-Isochrysis_galbana.AAC.1
MAGYGERDGGVGAWGALCQRRSRGCNCSRRKPGASRSLALRPAHTWLSLCAFSGARQQHSVV